MRSIRYFLSRVRELPPGTLIKKVTTKPLNFFKIKLEKCWAKLFPAYISDTELLKSVEGPASIEELLNTIKSGRPPFFMLPSTAAQDDFRFKAEIIDGAEKVCEHFFDLLGSGTVNLDEFIKKNGGIDACGYLPWHFDFKTGYKWNPQKFYKEIEMPLGKADTKVPWELSRFQHATVLGQAYRLTNNERYAREFVNQVEDWIRRNPPGYGVNWVCTMETAIRVSNWILGFYLFKDSDALDNEFLIEFLKSLLAHGRHIINNLENKTTTNNHYLADLAGLIYLGICFPELKEAGRWKDFGTSEMAVEIQKQVCDDGVSFENSTCYHRLALELFFYTAHLCQLNAVKVPDSYLERMKKMFDFVLYALKPNGKMPQIGDNDNSRMHILGKREILDMTYLMTFASLYYDDPRYKIDEYGFAPEALWLFGENAYDDWLGFEGRNLESLESKAFPDGGFYIMRNGKDVYVLICCGSNTSRGNMGHRHNDRLSVEICIDCNDIIIDPGTYVYTSNPEMRNEFRSTGFHNTVSVDNREQNKFSKNELFSMPEIKESECLEWKTNPEKDVFIGEHYGYEKLNGKVIHNRRIELIKSKKVIKVTDTFKGEGAHLLKWSFILAPGQKNKICINANEVRLEQKDGLYSPGYGVLVNTTRIAAAAEVELPATYSFIIQGE